MGYFCMRVIRKPYYKKKVYILRKRGAAAGISMHLMMGGAVSVYDNLEIQL